MAFWGLVRLLVTGVVAVVTVLVYGESLAAVHYLPFVFGILYGVAVVVGRPAAASNAFIEVAVDALLIAWVVIATGGNSSPWIWLYVVAGLGLARASRGPRQPVVTAVVSAALLLVSFSLAAMTTDFGYGAPAGAEPRLEPAAVTFDLRVEPYALAIFVLAVGACAVAFGVIYRRIEVAKHSAESAAVDQSALVEVLTSMVYRFGRHQYGLNEQRVLDTVVESAIEDLGYGYARAESFDDEARVPGRVQEAVRGGGEGAKDASKHGWRTGPANGADAQQRLYEHSLVDSENNTRGRLLVGGAGETGGDQRALRILAKQSGHALERVKTSPGGRDAVTDLPNRGSLRRAVQDNVTYEPRISVLVAEIEGLGTIDAVYGPAVTEAVLVEVSMVLKRDFVEVYGLSEQLYAVVPMPRPGNRSQTREVAGSVRRGVLEAIGEILEAYEPLRTAVEGECGDVEAGSTEEENPETRDVAYECIVGFVEATDKYDAEDLLGGIGPALESARRSADGIGGPGQLWRWRSIDSVVVAIASLDPWLNRHLYGTSDLARRIAERMDVGELDLEGLEVGALLHDAAKLFINPRVAHGNPSELADWERAEFEEIPTRGQMIFQDRGEDELPQTAYLSVLCHRERYDGGGYPGGLEGKAIPLCGRITAVADAMDDLLRRSLERLHTPEVVAEKLCEGGDREVITKLRNMLTAGRGTAYDPVVVDAALGVADEIEAKAGMIE